MYRAAIPFLLVASSFAASAQQGGAALQLAPQTTLPILFTRSVSAKKAHSGDAVEARTMQAVKLANGTTIPSGSRVRGHVTDGTAFTYDHTPYAKQKNALLSIQFDSVEANGNTLPLHVTVRAMADYYATEAAYEPKSTDLDPLGTLTLVGGDLLTPSQSEVRNHDDDVVAYARRSGVYAHLIPNGRCDGNSDEVSMGIFSATACGLYGYTNVSASDFGSVASPSTLTLTSRRTSPEILKHSSALLEVLPQEQASVGR
jgi:hypothetical protein